MNREASIEAKILVLNFPPGGALGDALEEILESSFRPGDQLRRELIESHAQRDGSLSGAGSGFSPSLIFLVLDLEQLERAAALIRTLRGERPGVAIIIVIEACGPRELLELLLLGASDFITPPLRPADTLPRVWRLLRQARPAERLTRTLKERIGLKQIIGGTSTFLAEIEKIPAIARCDGRVLISGETGTGKELCARAIHYLSPRTGKPFVPVNCGAIPSELVENELFGHERGAFTGANSSRPGLIQEAEGGTLFLDEIDCLPLMAQTKLLRFLQEKEYRPLGSAKMRRADVRVIAASNIDLEEAVREGRLRQDLYYRLNIIPLRLPPLRERREDIPVLARHFLAKYAAEVEREVADLMPEAIQKLVFYDWPGNVRELEHTIERAVMLSEAAHIGAEEIILPASEPTSVEESFQQAKAKIVAQFEKSYIQKLLLSHRGNISRAAQAARKNRRAFWQLIRKHRIDVRSFKLDAS